jgi:hypothetical protein
VSTYPGNQNATQETVHRYLLENYADAGNKPLTPEKVTELMTKHDVVVNSAISLASHAYYPGDQIGTAEKLEYIGTEEEEN